MRGLETFGYASRSVSGWRVMLLFGILCGWILEICWNVFLFCCDSVVLLGWFSGLESRLRFQNCFG